VLIDVEVRFRVVDPIAFVSNVLPPPAGLRALARAALIKELRSMPPGETLFPGDVEAAISPLMDAALTSGGTREIAVKVTRVRPGSVEDADEAEFQAFARQQRVKIPREEDAGKKRGSHDIRRR
jgi:regulator of protease activity HflC (stomatin/prohibitin superfamily)